MGEARLTFLTTLRVGLRGAPEGSIDDTVADFASHFDVGRLKGRSEEEIASALGDPLALAEEIRVELRIERWEASRTAASAITLIGAAIGLGAFNTALTVIALPLLCVVAFALLTTTLIAFGAGIWMLFAGASLGFGLLGTVLTSAGLIFAAVSVAALLALLAVGLIGAIARYARLHYRWLPDLNSRLDQEFP